MALALLVGQGRYALPIIHIIVSLVSLSVVASASNFFISSRFDSPNNREQSTQNMLNTHLIFDPAADPWCNTLGVRVQFLADAGEAAPPGIGLAVFGVAENIINPQAGYYLIPQEYGYEWRFHLQQKLLLRPIANTNTMTLYQHPACILDPQFPDDRAVYLSDDPEPPANTLFGTLDPITTVDLSDWQQTILPGDLPYDALLLHSGGWSPANGIEVSNTLNHPGYYRTEDTFFTRDGKTYHLLRPVSEAGSDTLGLTASVYADYQAHQPALNLSDASVIYFPQPRDLYWRELVMLAGFIELNPDQRDDFFDLLWLMERAITADELDPAVEQAWRETRDPAILREASIDVALPSSFWMAINLQPDAIDALFADAGYDFQREWNFDAPDGRFRYGYYLMILR